jgi:hypothetical protein
MRHTLSRYFATVLALGLLQVNPVQAAPDEAEIRAFVNDTCIVADEPYLMPPPDPNVAADQSTKFFPLIGLVVGKLAEMLINHIITTSNSHIKAEAARKDTRYAVTSEMNLYRADFEPEPALRLNARLGCMTIVAAKFMPSATDCSAAYLPKQLTREVMRLPESEWKATRTDDSIENQLRRANICVDGKARAVYEARFEFSQDGTAYRLRSAGYHIESLLTTQEKGASRSVIYTLEISQPGKTDQRETLSTAWVKLGTVAAGAQSAGSRDDSPPWLAVPALTVEARRAYDDKTKAQQQVMGEIDALKRIADASGDVAAGLAQERTKVAVQIQTQQAEIDASNAEYQDLPHTPLEFMPVTIVVAVTETQSEKAALQVLAGVIDSNTAQIASAGGTASANLFTRSLDVSGDAPKRNPAAELELARANYFDALIDARTPAEVGSDGNANGNLALARARYNGARQALGLTPIN